MEKDYFEILLEHVESNTQLLAEGLVGVNERLDRMEAGQEAIKKKMLVQDKLEAGQQMTLGHLEKLEAGQEFIKTDVRDIKRNTGSAPRPRCWPRPSS